MSALRPSPVPPKEPEYDPARETKPGHLRTGPLLLTPSARNKASAAKKAKHAFTKYPQVNDLGWGKKK